MGREEKVGRRRKRKQKKKQKRERKRRRIEGMGTK